MAAAIGAVAGLVMDYTAFDTAGYMVSVNFTDWLTHTFYVEGKQDAIWWAIGGAGLAG